MIRNDYVNRGTPEAYHEDACYFIFAKHGVTAEILASDENEINKD